MKYDIKAIINGAEIMDKAEPGKPSITGVALMNSVSSGALEIGSVAIDKLTLTLINPYKTAFDGDTVELLRMRMEMELTGSGSWRRWSEANQKKKALTTMTAKHMKRKRRKKETT